MSDRHARRRLRIGLGFSWAALRSRRGM